MRSHNRAFWRRHGLVLVPVLAFLIAALSWYRRGEFLAQIDLFFNYDSANLMLKTAGAWSHADSPFGPYGFPTFVPYYAVTAVLQRMWGVGLAQVTVIFLMFSAGAIGAYFLGRRVGLGLWGALAAATLYLFSPMTQFLVTFITGAAFFAVLPWLILCLELLAERWSAKRILLLCACSVLGLSTLGSTPQLLFELVLIVAIWFFARVLPRRGLRAYRSGAGLAAICIGVSLWWLVPVALAVAGAEIQRSLSSTAYGFVFSESSLLNMMRFITPWTWQYGDYYPYAVGYDGSPFSYGATLAFPALAAMSLLLQRGRLLALSRFAVITALLLLFLAKGTHEPLGVVNQAIYHFPLLFLTLEPAGLTIGALLFVSLAIGTLASRAAASCHTRAQRAGAAVFGALILAVAGLVAWPVFAGSMFRAGSPAWSSLPSMYVSVPTYWKQLREAMLRQPADDPVLLLPPNDEYQADYRWGYHGVDLVAMSLLRQPILMTGTPVSYTGNVRLSSLTRRLDAMLASGDPAFPHALHELGIRFVLFRDDVNSDAGVPVPPSRFRNNLRSDCRLANCRLTKYGPLLLADFGEAHWDVEFSSEWLQDRGSLTPGVALELASTFGSLPRMSDGRSASGGIIEERLMGPGAKSGIRQIVPGAGYSASSKLKGDRLVVFGRAPTHEPIFDSLSPTSMHVGHALITFLLEAGPFGEDRYAFNPENHWIRGRIGVVVRDGAERSVFLARNTWLGPGFTLLPPCKAGAICDAYRSAPSRGSSLIWEGGASADDLSVHTPATVALDPQHPVVKTAALWVGAVPLADDPEVTIVPSVPPTRAHVGAYLVLNVAGQTFGCYVDAFKHVVVREAASACLRNNGIEFQVEGASLRAVAAVFVDPIGWPFDVVSTMINSVTVAPLVWGNLSTPELPMTRVPHCDRSLQPGTHAYVTTQAQALFGEIRSTGITGMQFAPAGRAETEWLPFDDLTSLDLECSGTFHFVSHESGVLRLATARYARFASVLGSGEERVAQSFTKMRATVTIPIGGSTQVNGTISGMPGSQLDAAVIHLVNHVPGPVPFPRGDAANDAVAAVGGARIHATAAVVRSNAKSRAGVVLAKAPAPGIVVLNQLYDRFWLAVGVGNGARFLPHRVVDGWRNGWVASRAETILIFNAVDAFEALCAVCTILFVARLSWIAFRPRSS